MKRWKTFECGAVVDWARGRENWLCPKGSERSRKKITDTQVVFNVMYVCMPGMVYFS